MLFDVVFKGKFISKIDKPKAVLHFSKLFKLPVAKAERFFDGKPRALKKSLNLDKANHFRSALKKAGLRVSLQKQVDDKPVGLTMSKPGVRLVNEVPVIPQKIPSTNFNLDQVGIQLVKFVAVEKVEYDLAQLKMDQAGIVLIEPKPVPPVEIDTSNMTLDEVGSVFAQKKEIVEPVYDIDSLSIDEVGAVIVEKKEIPEPDINIDDIKMAD